MSESNISLNEREIINQLIIRPEDLPKKKDSTKEISSSDTQIESLDNTEVVENKESSVKDEIILEKSAEIIHSNNEIKYKYDSNKHTFKIITKDEKELMVDPSVFKLSPYFSAISEDQSSQEVEIPLNYNILYLVFEYLDHINQYPPQKIPSPIMDLTLKEYVSQSELDWVNNILSTQGLLVDLIYAANYLHVQPLLELCAAKIASLLKAVKTKEERIQVANSI